MIVLRNCTKSLVHFEHQNTVLLNDEKLARDLMSGTQQLL